MPRTARRISKTGFYHIIIRGVNKENIFIDNEDKKKFLQLLKYYKTQFDCKVYAYCLMSNHVHLLIEDRYLKIGDFMRNITSIYAGEFNNVKCKIKLIEKFKIKLIEFYQFFCYKFLYN